MAKSKVNNITELLRETQGEDLEILSKETTLLTAPGEHYGSVMLALKVKVKRKTTDMQEDWNLVAKLIPVNDMLKLAFDTPVTFKKEVFAYKETIPALVEFQKEYGVPESKHHDALFPKCLGARLSVDENKKTIDDGAVLIFENLTLQGFVTEDRLKGFDLSATTIIVQDLARYHAVPIALKIIKPDVFKEKVIPITVNHKGLEQLGPEVRLAFHNSVMDGARAVPELEPYLERLQKLVDHGFAHPWAKRGPPNEPWGTMCHADFWVSNTMILKDENGDTIKNKIIDLQLIRYWSCVCDLVFFLFTSVVNSVLDEHFNEFLKLYHQTFLDTLSDFNIDLSQFSWDNFMEELNETAPTELYHVLVMLKPICTERGKITNSSEEFQDSDWSREDLLGPNHRRKIKDTVFSIVKRGWL